MTNAAPVDNGCASNHSVCLLCHSAVLRADAAAPPMHRLSYSPGLSNVLMSILTESSAALQVSQNPGKPDIAYLDWLWQLLCDALCDLTQLTQRPVGLQAGQR